MRRAWLLLLVVSQLICVSAQDYSASRASMKYSINGKEIPLLLAYDQSIVESDKGSIAIIDTEKDTFSKKELASIFGVKPKQIKAYMVLRENDATAKWGVRGMNGALEVLSSRKYRQLKKEGKLDSRFRIAE
jgi:hypothetical protein